MTINEIIAAQLERTEQDGNVLHINSRVARKLERKRRKHEASRVAPEATDAEVRSYVGSEPAPLNTPFTGLTLEVQV